MDNRKLVAKRCSDFDYPDYNERPYAVVLDIHDSEGHYIEQGTDWSYFATEKEAEEFIKQYNK